MATLQRQQKKQNDLNQLQQLLGIYQQFSPEAKARESLVGAQATGAHLQNREQSMGMDLRQQLLQGQVGQQQFGLENARAMAPEQLRALQAEIESRTLGNQRDAAVLPFAGDMARAQSSMAGTQAHVAQATAPAQIEDAGLRNLLSKGQIAMQPGAQAQQAATTRNIEGDTSSRKALLPWQMAGQAAGINQSSWQPGQPPPIPQEMIMSLLSGQGVNMSPAQQSPQLPLAVSQDLGAFQSGAMRPDMFGGVVSQPMPGGVTPKFHAILSAIEASPDGPAPGIPWPPQYLELYRRLKANPDYNPSGDKF